LHVTSDAHELITHIAFKNCFVKRAFSIDHISRTDDSAVDLDEHEEDG
jgi:hypothetical protein